MADGKTGRSQVRTNSGRDMAFEVSLGARIRAARVAAGMTQRALGDAVGIAYQKLQKYELGQDRIAVSTLRRIASALNLHPGQLFDDSMPKATGMVAVVVARRSIELAQAKPDPLVVERLLALVDELGNSSEHEHSATRRALAAPEPHAKAAPTAKSTGEQVHRRQVDPLQAVVAPLLALLQQTGSGDAGALARLLGQALSEAEKAVKRTPRPRH